ncbi:hypothetical protein PMAYCL1PPCAC_13236 [Pristionchus mayeri]|uniref:Uncharacterized protein n=1 Tax=Pristionchus mayeri TaxID=1317129 RepID=A0AAN5CH92_9BILA|nr:hypothetical protein PMAYCL1PPCAC_13236 [Pristionchus mayeri]
MTQTLYISILSLHILSPITNLILQLGELLSLLEDVINTSLHVEGNLGKMIEFSLEDHLESLDSILQTDELSCVTSEDLSHLEGLGQELLDLTGAGHSQLVVLRQLVHSKNGDDVLKRLVVLEDLLDTTSNVVMVLSDDVGVHDTGGGIERVDSGVDTQLGNTTGKHSGGVKMGEGGGRGGISKIVSRHVDSLDGGDGSLLGGGNTLLHATHVSGEGRLVSYGRGDTTEEGRHLRTGLGETEDVVDEEKHILTLLVTEVLGDREAGEAHTGTSSGRLVHLSVHEGHLGVVALQVDDTSLNHLVVEIVTLTGTLTDSGEHRVTSVSLGDVVNELHDKHSLSDTGTSEETDLSSLGVRGKKIDDLDTSRKNLLLDGHLDELGSLSVNGGLGLGVDGASLVNGLSNDVHDTAESLGSDGDLDRISGVDDLLATDKTLGTVHSNGTDDILTEMLGDLKNETGRASSDLKTVEDGREVLIELNVDDGTDNGGNASLGSSNGLGRGLLGGGGSRLGRNGSVDSLLRVYGGRVAASGNSRCETLHVRLKNASSGLATDLRQSS